MKLPGCNRVWQAEAIADGRLSAADAAAFSRHAAQCELCTRELRALKALRAAAAQLPVLENTPLERRRQRNELLRRANELTLAARRGWAGWRLRPLLLALGACAGLALAVLSWPALRTTPARVWVQPSVPSFQIVTSRNATWQTLERAATLRLLAQRGRLEIAVDKLRRGQRFVLALPDGELEVKGTRFVVDVGDGATERVQVREGRVALRIRGQAERLLSAGQGWVNEALLMSSSAAAAPAHDTPEAPVGAASGSAAPHVRHRPQPRPRGADAADAGSAAAPEAGAPEAASPAALAGASFASAMSAFTAGGYAQADALFQRFEREHPGDTRIEDALFLRAVAHVRRGDIAASRVLARSYLTRFPHGLRRAEAERMAAPP